MPEGVKNAEIYADAGGYVSMCFRYLIYFTLAPRLNSPRNSNSIKSNAMRFKQKEEKST